MAADIDTLIAELRAGLGRNQNVWHLERDELHALLDHIESCGNELDALMAERAEFKRRAEAAEAELARLRAPVGEVGETVERLQAWHHHAAEQASRDWDEQDELRHLFKHARNVAGDAADLLTRLAARVAEGERVIEGFLCRADAYLASDLSHYSAHNLLVTYIAWDEARNYLQKDRTDVVE